MFGQLVILLLVSALEQILHNRHFIFCLHIRKTNLKEGKHGERKVKRTYSDGLVAFEKSFEMASNMDIDPNVSDCIGSSDHQSFVLFSRHNIHATNSHLIPLLVLQYVDSSSEIKEMIADIKGSGTHFMQNSAPSSLCSTISTFGGASESIKIGKTSIKESHRSRSALMRLQLPEFGCFEKASPGTEWPVERRWGMVVAGRTNCLVEDQSKTTPSGRSN